jgi:tetratricopeptide (TPR) repeat protein
MNLADMYNRVINWPGRTAEIVALSVAMALLFVAGVILSTNKLRKSARSLGIVGVVVIMALLWVVHEQTVSVKKGAYMTVTTYRYPERARMGLLIGLVALPTLAAIVMSSVFVSTRRRLRALGPSHLKAGRRHHAQKKFKAALREYNEAIQSSPDLAEPYFRRACLYHTMGEKAHAMADLERAIQRDPRFASAYLQRGKMCLESGDYDSALADFGMLMTIRPNDPESLLNRGICLVKKGLWSEAAGDFHRVLKLTNHSDFADPAKQYLRECEPDGGRSMPSAGTNGSGASAPKKEPNAPELMI